MRLVEDEIDSITKIEIEKGDFELYDTELSKEYDRYNKANNFNTEMMEIVISQLHYYNQALLVSEKNPDAMIYYIDTLELYNKEGLKRISALENKIEDHEKSYLESVKKGD